MKNTVKPQTDPAIETQNPKPAFEAFESFEWIPGYMSQGATVPAKELAEFANHVLDVARGAALVFDLINDADCRSAGGRGNYLNHIHLGLLRNMATRSLLCLNQEAEHIADTIIANSLGKS